MARIIPATNTRANAITVEEVAYHRNGISGAGFSVVKFDDADQGHMVGIVFEDDHHVAVFNLDKLGEGDIAFGSNSWRGDSYELQLRIAIAHDYIERHGDKCYHCDAEHGLIVNETKGRIICSQCGHEEE